MLNTLFKLFNTFQYTVVHFECFRYYFSMLLFSSAGFFFFFLNYVRISPAKVLLNYVPTTSCNTGEHEGGKNHSVALLYNFLITRCCLRLETT